MDEVNYITENNIDMDIIKKLNGETDYQEMLKVSRERPVFLFKHSTGFYTSLNRWQFFKEFAKKHSVIEYWYVLELQNGEISQLISKKIGIRHESPQVILFINGLAVWHVSQWEICEREMLKRIDRTNSGLFSNT